MVRNGLQKNYNYHERHTLLQCHGMDIISETPVVDRNESTLFSLVSTTRDTDPPVFTLCFNVTTLPPSTVTCTVNGTMIDIPDEDIDRSVTEAQYPDTSVLVTVTIRSRQSGSYQCTIGGISGNMESTSVPLIITGIMIRICYYHSYFQCYLLLFYSHQSTY